MNTDKIVNFLFEIATLRRLTRSHRQVIEKVSDNVSDHSFRVAIIGMILAKLENCDEDKVLKMCLFHDAVEARVGDANFVNQQYVTQREDEARYDQMQGLPIIDEVIELLKEYEKRETKEAIVAKDADVLDQMVLQQEYFYEDKENMEKWHNYHNRRLQSDSAKTLAKKIRTTNPLEWVYEVGRQKNKIT